MTLWHWDRDPNLGFPPPITINGRKYRSEKDLKRFEFIRRVATEACKQLPRLCASWLPNGRQQGAEWVALNPRRDDSRPGSFKVNARTGRWADFATGDKGGDAVSLLAYLKGISQAEAAELLARELGIVS